MTDEPAVCEFCGETHGWLYMHARCHPEAPTWTLFSPTTGELVIECSVCEQKVGAYKVVKVIRQ